MMLIFMTKNMRTPTLFITLTASLLFIACDLQQPASRELGPLPAPPEFSVEEVPGNPNQVVVRLLSTDFFDFIWDLPGGTPKTSKAPVDTIFYQRAGTYPISLHAAHTSGNGTAVSTQTITIAQDATLECNATLRLLTNDCSTQCWKLSPERGSIQVGPVPLSSEWYNSPGLDDAQIDDLWCFNAETGAFIYDNGGETFSVCAGYVSVPDYNIPPNAGFTFSPSASGNAEFMLTLDEGSWMGVEDSGPVYEIVSISENELVMLSPIRPCDGSASPGWFTLTFIKP